jgi:hypothetical protein
MSSRKIWSFTDYEYFKFASTSPDVGLERRKYANGIPFSYDAYDLENFGRQTYSIIIPEVKRPEISERNRSLGHPGNSRGGVDGRFDCPPRCRDGGFRLASESVIVVSRFAGCPASEGCVSIPQIHRGYHPDNTHCLRELCHSVFPQVGASKQWIQNARHRSYSRIALPAGELRLGERKLEFVILEVTRSEMFVGGPTTLGGTASRILLPLLPIGILEEALIVPRLWRDDGWCPYPMEFRSDPHTAHLQGIFFIFTTNISMQPHSVMLSPSENIFWLK